MTSITFKAKEITKKCVAIVMFGPPTTVSGFRPAEYYQVTIDLTKVSPSGEYIYFGLNDNDQITGWQRIAAMTICEILGEYDNNGNYPPALPTNDKVVMNVIE